MTTDLPIPDPVPPGRSGMVAVVGRANVGKSTLINQLLGEKVSIVSPVAQTTRNLIRGIHTEARGQICLLDTPGMHRAESDLGKVMNRIARASIEGVDAILLLMDVSVAPRVEDDGWRLHSPTPGQKLLPPEPLFSKLDEELAEEESDRLQQSSSE